MIKEKKRKEEFTLFSDHNGRLLRRQPGAVKNNVSHIKADSPDKYSTNIKGHKMLQDNAAYALMHDYSGFWFLPCWSLAQPAGQGFSICSC